jgi:hypothetical protein
MPESLAEEYAKLSYRQKVLFSGLVRKELADAVLVAVRRLRHVSENSRNDAAATTASKALLALAEKKGVLKTDEMDELQDELLNALNNGDAVPSSF